MVSLIDISVDWFWFCYVDMYADDVAKVADVAEHKRSGLRVCRHRSATSDGKDGSPVCTYMSDLFSIIGGRRVGSEGMQCREDLCREGCPRRLDLKLIR